MMTQPPTLASAHASALLSQCVHCGLCLPACPTYAVLQTEMDSPRGRIQLMDAVASERIAPHGTFRVHIERCLGCRACETACPSGVQYGSLLEMARADIEQPHRANGAVDRNSVASGQRALRRLALRDLMPHRRRLRLLARLLTIYQRLGLAALVRRGRLLPSALRNLEALLPPLSAVFPDYGTPLPAIGPKRGDVAFLYGCVQDAFLGSVNAASIRVLRRNGYAVHFPVDQTCCGAAALHLGENDLARDLARRNIQALDPSRYDAIISNAGGCGAALKAYPQLFAADPASASPADRFSAKVQDISEFLAAVQIVPPQGRIPARAVYADSCHLRHVQRIVEQPRHILRQIPGLTLVEMRRPDHCCGSAGVYNIVQRETADLVLDAKMADIGETGANLIVTSNTGCHLQYLYGVARAGLKAQVVHWVEVLDWSYGGESA